MKEYFKFTNEEKNSACKCAFTLAESGQRPHLDLATKENKTNFVILNLFQDLSHDEISREIPKDKLLLRRWPSFTIGQMLKRVQHDMPSNVIACLTRDLPPLSGTTPREEIAQRNDGRLHPTVPLRNDMNSARKCAFTLAETLIALAVIGIVAALTIPGIVKNYNQKAWGHAQDVFARKLDVALKEMNTEGTLTGYRTTEEFVNELKKNIKITKICTGSQITNCFADKVVWNEGEDPIEITTSSVKFAESKENAFDWAEPVGIQFVNGVNAIIGYNKNCYSDPYNNQYSPSSTCIGIMYDVSGFKKPNARDKDIASNGNVALQGCALKATYGGESVCFTKIYAPGEYEPFPMTINGGTVTCTQALGKYIDNSTYGCYYGNSSDSKDYWAGAQYACGGKKANMASSAQLTLLAKYLYNTDSLSTTQGSLKMQENRLGPFKTYYTTNTGYWNSSYTPENYFRVWGGAEGNNSYACSRNFYSSYTDDNIFSNGRSNTDRFAVCVK